MIYGLEWWVWAWLGAAHLSAFVAGGMVMAILAMQRKPTPTPTPPLDLNARANEFWRKANATPHERQVFAEAALELRRREAGEVLQHVTEPQFHRVPRRPAWVRDVAEAARAGGFQFDA